MSSAENSWNYNTSIPSDHRRGCEIIQLLLTRLEQSGWNSADLFAIQMALEESIMNAIKHGNKRDLAKQVRIAVQVTDQDFRLTVTDEGAGFALCDVPDPTLDENLDKCSGRGIMLMRQLMDSVHYNARGNSVEMVKSKCPCC